MHISQQSETLDHRYLENRFRRLDSVVGRAKELDVLSSDYLLEALLIGSGYLIEMGAKEGTHLHYEDKDIDLYVPDEEAFEELCGLENVYPSEVDEVAHINLNRNWKIGVPLECFSGLPSEFGAEDQDMIESLLESEVDDPAEVA